MQINLKFWDTLASALGGHDVLNIGAIIQYDWLSSFAFRTSVVPRHVFWI